MKLSLVVLVVGLTWVIGLLAFDIGREEDAEPEGASGELQGVLASYEAAQSEIDEKAGEQEVGEYQVAYIVESGEGWWEGEPESLEWREPAAGETNHIEILPFEAKTGQMIPAMEVP